MHPQALAVPPPPQVLGQVHGKVPSLSTVVPQFVVTDLESQKVLRAGSYEVISVSRFAVLQVSYVPPTQFFVPAIEQFPRVLVQDFFQGIVAVPRITPSEESHDPPH